MHPVHGRGEKFQCGVDEAGRGPVIGPMILTIVCGERDLLEKIGSRDSKSLTPARRENIALRIRKEAQYIESTEISAEELNQSMQSRTLNEIEMDAVTGLLRKARYVTYVDCFDVNEERGSRNLSDGADFPVICLHEADRFIPAVSAASIISKVTRDARMKEIEKEYGVMGSGYPSDPRTVSFLENAIREGTDLEKIVRKKWKTYTNMKKKFGQKDIYRF